MELNKELLEKAKTATSAEELLALAKENGIEMTEEEAKEYFSKLNTKTGELADDELDNVSGGCSSGDEEREGGRSRSCLYCGSKEITEKKFLYKTGASRKALYCEKCKKYLSGL